jgi:hypothetical protein
MKRRIATAFAVVAASAGFAACGDEEEVHFGETEGIYLTVGELRYQVQISRPLNPNDVEDKGYFTGVSKAAKDLAPDEEWFGVFLRVENIEDDESYTSARDIQIEDTTGARFSPIPIDTDANVLAYKPGEITPKNLIPTKGSAESGSPTQGALLLFKLPRATLENRPLELIIKGDGFPAEEARVHLDV